MKKKYSIGFIGCGNMSNAIINALNQNIGKSLVKSQGYKLSLSVSDINEDKLNKMDDGIFTTTDNQTLIDNSDMVVLAIKPQNAQQVCQNCNFEGKIILSIMAGVTINTIINYTNSKTDKIIRVMPNLNARIGFAYSTYFTKGLSEDEEELVGIILNTFGDCQKLDNEELLDVTTGLCGSGPAFVFKFINAFINDAKKYGFDDETAKKMAIGTIMGSVSLIESSNTSIDDLVTSVCSKGGTTIEGVNYLNDNNFEDIVMTSIDKAIIKAKELSK